ncbi:MAG: 2-phosphosulfolactate phosphatase [Planctomycetales bacterium]|nr:2-phosphosulfolactate phosphatase [Planctomycetales bacterium]
MTRKIEVHFLPELVASESLRGATVVVIDVLRASTTIAQALAAGAKEVVPFRDVDATRRHSESLPRESYVLGGERGGVMIDLFDLGNSPAEYTPESVGGRSVLFTTTNGTKALERCREAYRVLIGAAVNLAAVCESLGETLNIQLLCAGTAGEVTREDVLLAGAIAYQLSRHDEGIELNDSAQIAIAGWRNIVARAVGAGKSVSDHLAAEFRATRGGRNLLQIGHGDDLTLASRIDSLAIVPELDLQNWRIGLP